MLPYVFFSSFKLKGEGKVPVFYILVYQNVAWSHYFTGTSFMEHC